MAVIIIAITVFLYVQIIRITFFFNLLTAIYINVASSTLVEIIGTIVLGCGIICESIVFIHLFLYLILCYQGAAGYQNKKNNDQTSNSPGVTVLIPTCDEPPESIERSLSSVQNLEYPNLRVILVENSRNYDYKKIAHQLAVKYRIDVIDIPNRGTKASALNDARPFLDQNIKYLAVFDADQLILKNLIRDLLPILEEETNLAFIQTAQAYENNNESLLAFAASQQQMLVYDCVMEGKAIKNRVPCFGTNFVMRLDALDSIGGWDETNVTEDLATSYHIHKKGWKSKYIRKIYALGLAPPSLEAYWRQQKRWATGNSSLALSLIKGVFKQDKTNFTIAIEYLWSAGFYLNTFLISFLSLLPTITLIAGFLFVPEFYLFRYHFGSPVWIFVSLYSLYILVLFFPLMNMFMRGYPLFNMLLVQSLTTITSPVYFKGVKASIFDRSPVLFETSLRKKTSQTNNRRRPWCTPQTGGLIVFTITGSFFTSLAISNPDNPIAWILSFWSFIHSLSLGHIFLFDIRN
ncbi:MAG: glycosyltransferase [Thermodesulfobacteriota bacterium]|nr:glycosyltransferase [Thermodesulfobacteriota bacterium]